MPTHNALLGLLQRKLPVARNALANIAAKPWPYTDPRAFATGMGTAPSEEAAKYGVSFLPGIGDAVGLAQDVGGYIQDPNSLTPLSGLLSLAAIMPLVPRQISTVRAFDMEWKPTAKQVEVLTNPTASDVKRIFGSRPTRWLRSKSGNVYFWNAESAHHEGVARGLTKLGEEFKPSPRGYQFPLPGEGVEPISGYATFGKGGFRLTDQNNKDYGLGDLIGKGFD